MDKSYHNSGVNMDVLFINSINFSHSNAGPALGLYSLSGVLKRETSLSSKVINFDYLNEIGVLKYVDDLDINIDNMVAYIRSFQPKVVSFYTMCNSYGITLCVAEKLKKSMQKSSLH